MVKLVTTVILKSDDCSSLCHSLCGNGAWTLVRNDDVISIPMAAECSTVVCGDSIVSTTEECDDGNQVTETCLTVKHPVRFVQMDVAS